MAASTTTANGAVTTTGQILDILTGEESFKLSHQLSIAPSTIWIVAGAILAGMLTAIAVRAIFD